MSTRNIKELRITPEWFVDFLKGGLRCIETTGECIPENAKVVEMRADNYSKEFVIVLESPDFDDVAQGMRVPPIRPQIRRDYEREQLNPRQE